MDGRTDRERWKGVIGSVRRFPALALLFVSLAVCFSTTAHAQCSNPAGAEGKMIYNGDDTVPQYCDGTNWRAMMHRFGTPEGVYNPSTYDMENGGAVPSDFVVGAFIGSNWDVATDQAYEGTYSMKSPSQGATSFDDAYFSLTVTLDVPKTVSFYRRIDTETGCSFCDGLFFYIDHDEMGKWDGTQTTWTQESFAVPAGTHILVWRFTRDDGGGNGANAVWVDLIEFN